MPLAGDSFQVQNRPPDLSLPHNMEYFTLSAAPNTRLWRQSAGHEISSAPIIYKSIENEFTLAEVTVIARYLTEYDQGGLVLFAHRQPEHGISPALAAPTCRWVKVGFEIDCGELNVVSEYANFDGTDRAPIFLSPYSMSPVHLGVKFQRENDTLWIWYQQELPSSFDPSGVASSWRRQRQIAGFFPTRGKMQVKIGVYASRPNPNLAEDMVVEFEDLEIL